MFEYKQVVIFCFFSLLDFMWFDHFAQTRLRDMDLDIPDEARRFKRDRVYLAWLAFGTGLVSINVLG